MTLVYPLGVKMTNSSTKITKFSFVLFVSLFALDAFAASSSSTSGTTKDFGDLMPNIIQQIGWFKILIVACFGLVGVFFAGTGVLGLIHSQDPNRRQEIKAGQAAVKLLGGVVLLSLGFAIFLTMNSTLGTEAQSGNGYYTEKYRGDPS